MSFDDVKMVVQGTDIQIIHAGSEQETLLLPPKVVDAQSIYISRKMLSKKLHIWCTV